MRATNTFALFAGVTGVVLAGLALTGCGPSTAAAPEQTRTSTVTKTVTAPSNPTSTTQSSSTGSTSTSTGSTNSRTGGGAAKPAGTLGPNGYGKLKLGMSLDEAKVVATIKEWWQSSEVCVQYELFTAGKFDGYVYITKARGVVVIGPDSRQVRTPEGVTIGSTVAKVKAAYPSWDQEGMGHNRSRVTVPGNSKADYRISFTNGAVETITLQYQDHACYE